MDDYKPKSMRREDDGFDDAIVKKIHEAVDSAKEKKAASADEMEAWLEAV